MKVLGSKGMSEAHATKQETGARLKQVKIRVSRRCQMIKGGLVVGDRFN